jgi:hypothetical protein
MTGGRVNINARLTPSGALHPWNRALTECAGDGCLCKHGLPVHPPLLMTFDPELGKYLEAPRRCSALWAVATEGRDRGRHCGEPATHQVADVLVCEHHYRRMREWMNTRDQRDALAAVRTAEIVHENQMRLARKRAEQQRELDRETARQRIALAKEEAKERVRAEEAARAEASLIYYARRESDGLIKIGTSRVLAGRLATLKLEHGPLQLMAVEGGSHKQENALHRQFAGLRAEGREWFRPELPLLEHVYRIMRERPVEAAPGLPPILGSRVVGGMIQGLRVERNRERRRLEQEQKPKRQRKDAA